MYTKSSLALGVIYWTSVSRWFHRAVERFGDVLADVKGNSEVTEDVTVYPGTVVHLVFLGIVRKQRLTELVGSIGSGKKETEFLYV